MKKIILIALLFKLFNTSLLAQTYCITATKVSQTPTTMTVSFTLSSSSPTSLTADLTLEVTGSGGISGSEIVPGSAIAIGNGQNTLITAAINPTGLYTFNIVNSSNAMFTLNEAFPLGVFVPQKIPIDPGCPINSLVVLPVELLNFAAEKRGNRSVVKWETLGEKNIENFIVERSADGVNYKALGFERPKAAQAEKRESYEFIDEQPEIGINYYRLQSKGAKKEDFKYSKVVSVDFGLGLKAKAFPNPFAAELSIEIDVEQGIKGEVTIDMFDTAGKQVLTKKINAEGRKLIFEVPTEGLVPGSYVIRVKNGSSTWQHKITKQ
jgi:Secretion system C-terminal sorting domain